MNNPTIGEFYFAMIGRADIEESKSNVAMNAWLPQASYPCGNFSDTSSLNAAEVVTTRGTFTIELDASVAPNTVNNFVVLARYHYYDDVPFHRIIPGFVVQGGDATGNPLGTGGPGYTFEDESPEDGAYEIGSVAMANSGPDTNGSQFFVVTGEQGVALPSLYSLFGTVTDGLDVVLDIESTGLQSGAPVEETLIESVTVTES